ncbi:MAG: S8 family serine peptidase [Acidobacteriota bacterium]|nr:S8 family serine peptidase [Blastocatellia bacterium]MDW8238545.1 S8 family serine peptidase [Acidobacteriota bacterium]
MKTTTRKAQAFPMVKQAIIKMQALTMLTVVMLVTLTLTSAPLPEADNLNTTAHAQRERVMLYVNNQLLVKLSAEAQAKPFAQRYGLTLKRHIKANLHLFEIAAADVTSVEDLVAHVKRDRDVIWAEPNYLAKLDQNTDQLPDPSVDQRHVPRVSDRLPSEHLRQYAITQVKGEQAHHYSTGAGTWVAVIDTGADESHPAIRQVIQPGWDFVSDDDDPSESGHGSSYGHGTAIASVIHLIAPDATLVAYRAFNADGLGTAADIASAIYDAVDYYWVDVINAGFSIPVDSSTLSEAIEYARQRGVVLIASAGNAAERAARYPAIYAGVIGVAATDSTDRRAPFSNYGAGVDVAAPGVNIHGAYPGNRWARWSGTSLATALVSGQAALILAEGRSIDVMSRTADPVVDTELRAGRINCLRALQ